MKVYIFLSARYLLTVILWLLLLLCKYRKCYWLTFFSSQLENSGFCFIAVDDDVRCGIYFNIYKFFFPLLVDWLTDLLAKNVHIWKPNKYTLRMWWLPTKCNWRRCAPIFKVYKQNINHAWSTIQLTKEDGCLFLHYKVMSFN